MAKKKYWKVVRNFNDKWYSAIMNIDNGKHCRRYYTGKFTKSSGGARKAGYLLTCFGRKKDAVRFAREENRDDHEVWEVGVDGEVTTDRLPPTWAFIYSGPGNPDDWPEGTVMAEKIKLVRRVK